VPSFALVDAPPRCSPGHSDRTNAYPSAPQRLTFGSGKIQLPDSLTERTQEVFYFQRSNK